MSRNYRKLPLNVNPGGIPGNFPDGKSGKLPGKFHFYRETLHWGTTVDYNEDANCYIMRYQLTRRANSN